MKKLLWKLISLCAFVNFRIAKIDIIWQIIKLINVLIFFWNLIKDQVMLSIDNTSVKPYISYTYSFLGGAYPDGQTIIQLLCVQSSILLILIVSLLYYLKNDITMTDGTQITRIQIFVMYFPIFVLTVTQLFYSISTTCLVNLFISKSGSQKFYSHITQSILTLILIIICTVYNPAKRHFSYFLPLMLLLIQLLETVILAVIVIVISLFFSYKEKMLMNKCAYCSFIIASLFKILIWISSEQNFITLTYLFSSLLFAEFILVKNHIFSSIQKFSEEQNNSFIIECASNLQKNMPSTFKESEIVRIESIFRTFYEKYWIQLRYFSKKICSRNFKEISYQELLQIFDKKLSMGFQKNASNLNLKKQFLLFRICNNYKMHDSIKIIGDFIDSSNCINSLSNKQIYIRKWIQLSVYEQFLTKQSDNEKIKEMVKLSNIQQNYVNTSLELFNDIYAFWQRINYEALIQEQIEENFYRIASGLQKLQKLLRKLKFGYKAQWQKKVLQILTKMVYPISNTIQYNHHFSQNGQIKQNTLIFFVVRNKTIVKASPCFLKVVNYTDQQLAGCSMERVIPSDVVKSVKLRQNDTIKSLKKFSVIPILTNGFEIKAFQINAKLQPKAVSGIEYFYFLKKVESDEKRAYIYVNTSDLLIESVSQQFFEIFDLDRNTVQTKIQKKQLFLNSIITNYQASSISDSIQQKKNLKCEFSMKFLKQKSKYTANQNRILYYKGTACLENAFSSHQFISLYTFNPQCVYRSEKAKSREKIYNQLAVNDNLTDVYKNHDQINSTATKMLSIKSLKKQQPKQDGEEDELNSENFCPIQNPYKQKIQEKQSQLSQGHSRRVLTYSFCIIALSLVLLLFFLVTAVLLIFYCQQQNKSFSDIIDNFNKVSDCSHSLIHGTFQVYEHYHIAMNKQKVQKFIIDNNGTITVQDLLHQKQLHIHLIIKKFQQSFTKFYNRQIFKNELYSVFYQHYEVKTNLASTNLYQYVYNLKMANEKMRLAYIQSKSNNTSLIDLINKESHPLKILEKNYPQIASLDAPFRSMNSLAQVSFANLTIFQIIISCICGVGLIFLFLVSYSIKINVQTVKNIFYIFSLVKKNVIDKRFKELSSSLEIFTSHVPKDSLKKLSDLNRIREGAIMVYHSKVRYSMKTVKLDYEKIRQDDNQQAKVIFSNKNHSWYYVFENLKVFFIIALVFFLVLGSFFYKIQINLQQDKVNNQYLSQIAILKFNELKNSAQLFYIATMPQISNKSFPLQNQVREKRSSVQKSLSSNFTNSFKQFFKQQIQTLKQDLCLKSVEVEQYSLQNLMDCENIGLGILKKGYIQASEYYDYMIQKIKAGQVALFDISPYQKYNNIFIHIYVREKMLKQIQNLQNSLKRNRVSLQLKYSVNMIGFGIGFFLIAVALTFYLLCNFIPNILKIRKVGVGYFKILPKETLQKIQISLYIRDNQLLQRVSML